MNQIRASILNSNKLMLTKFNGDSMNFNLIEEENIEQVLNYIFGQEILEFTESSDHKQISIKYSDFEFVISNFDVIPKREELANLFRPLFLRLKKYDESHKVQQVSKNKVQRKNKYVNKKIVVAGVALIITSMVASGVYLSMSKDGQKASIPVPKESIGSFNFNDKNELSKTSFSPSESLEIKVDEVNNNIYDIDTKLEEASNQKEQAVSLEYEDKTATQKAQFTVKEYGDMITKYSNMYGLDSKLMIALATQERGVHSPVMDKGGDTGLMQVRNEEWAGESLYVYNFESNSYEQIIVDEASLSDLEYNIKVACMIFQEGLRETKYNILMAIQCYNMGSPEIEKMVAAYCNDTGKSKESVFSDQFDNGWMNYRNLINHGDHSYIENVLSNYGESCTISMTKPDGTQVFVNVNNFPLDKELNDDYALKK